MISEAESKFIALSFAAFFGAVGFGLIWMFIRERFLPWRGGP